MVLPMVVPQKFGTWHPYTMIIINNLKEIWHQRQPKVFTLKDLYHNSQTVVCRKSYELLLKNRVNPFALLPQVLSKCALWTLNWMVSSYLHPLVTQILSNHASCTLTGIVSLHLYPLATNFVVTLSYIRTMTLKGYISYRNSVLPSDTSLNHPIWYV